MAAGYSRFHPAAAAPGFVDKQCRWPAVHGRKLFLLPRGSNLVERRFPFLTIRIAMQATFVVVEPNLTPNEYTVELPATIGRGREAHLKFTNGLLSRRHCEVVEEEGEIVVRDLGSRNGTFIGGRRVQSATLSPGELITVGGITLRALFGDADDVMLAPEKFGADAMLAETIPMEETQTVEAKSFADVEEEQWPEEESSLDLQPAIESDEVKFASDDVSMEEISMDEIEWLDESAESPDKDTKSEKPKKPDPGDDDFDRFLEGLR